MGFIAFSRCQSIDVSCGIDSRSLLESQQSFQDGKVQSYHLKSFDSNQGRRLPFTCGDGIEVRRRVQTQLSKHEFQMRSESASSSVVHSFCSILSVCSPSSPSIHLPLALSRSHHGMNESFDLESTDELGIHGQQLCNTQLGVTTVPPHKMLPANSTSFSMNNAESSNQMNGLFSM